MFQSTKVINLGSCAFRQPRAKSHCKFMHGYNLNAKFWFVSDELDENHWVVDFGGLKNLKDILQQQFDHTTCIAADDPVLPVFEELQRQGACDLRVMANGTGVERIAEWCLKTADAVVRQGSNSKRRCVKVEVFEHENNSAICVLPHPEPAPVADSVDEDSPELPLDLPSSVSKPQPPADEQRTWDFGTKWF